MLREMAALGPDLKGARLHLFHSDADRARIGAMMIDAAQAVTRDRQQSRDGFELFRSSWDEIQKHKDGLTLDAQGLSALTTAVAKLLPASDRRSGDDFWLGQTRKTHTRTAAAYGVVAVRDAGDNASRLVGGRLLERIHLWCTANAIALQHMNQMTERADRERQLGLPGRFGPAVEALLPGGDEEALVAFRVGYASGAMELRRSSAVVAGRRVLIGLGLVVPALICFTTVGRLWYLPGALLLGSGALVARATPRAEAFRALDAQHWRRGLLVVCGAYYVALGATALGVAGGLGVVGGALIWAAAGGGA